MSNVEPDEQPSQEDVYDALRRGQIIRQGFILGLIFVIGLLTFLGLRFINFNVGDLWAQRSVFTNFLGNFFPPNFREFTLYTKQNDINGPKAITRSFRNFGAPIVDTLVSNEPAAQTTLVRMSLVTLILGFTGTVLGFPLALTFGVLGSERVIPFPFNFIFRGTMSAIRAIPALVWIFIYIPLAGINPVGAVLAISTDTIGNMGRLFTDELEEIEEGPIEAVESTGASRSQVVSFGMLSQVSTSFIAWALYVLEINVRIAIGLGVVGAGGIGRYIKLRQDLFAYQEMAAGIVMVFIIVISVEFFSSRIRARLRPSEHDSRGLGEVIKSLGDVDRWLGRDPKK
jgi:phosphonate transport system permease protein